MKLGYKVLIGLGTALAGGYLGERAYDRNRQEKALTFDLDQKIVKFGGDKLLTLPVGNGKAKQYTLDAYKKIVDEQTPDFFTWPFSNVLHFHDKDDTGRKLDLHTEITDQMLADYDASGDIWLNPNQLYDTQGNEIDQTKEKPEK